MARKPSTRRSAQPPAADTNNAPPDRVSRKCASCGVDDTHSHHVQYVAFLHPITKESTDLSVSKHVQCCAADGCEICATDIEHSQLAGVTEPGPTHEFTHYMQNKTDAHHQSLFEKHGIESHLFNTSAEEAS